MQLLESRNPHFSGSLALFVFLSTIASRDTLEPDESKVMETRTSTRSIRTRSTSNPQAYEQNSSPGSSASHRKRPAIEAAAGIFPLLDDETARIVVSYLPAVFLGDRSEVLLR